MSRRGTKYDWQTIIPTAISIVESYDTGVTLRQLFYRLVSVELLPNIDAAYSALSSRTAKLRRQGEFPDLLDRTRSIHVPPSFSGPDAAIRLLLRLYRRDRTEGQAWTICVAVEKSGLVQQLTSWFGEYGLPVLALSGFSSQSYVQQVTRYVTSQGRPAVLLYGGDFDPSGLDIERDFRERTPVFDEVVRVALTKEQIAEYRLPRLEGKKSDSRAARFAEEHGALYQVEIDALEPSVLHDLFKTAVEDFWDPVAYAAVMAQEEAEHRMLSDLVA